MNPLSSPLRRLLLGAAPALLLALTSCGGKDAPRYKLSAEEHAWTDAYRNDDVWRFRNPATGYERRYRVKDFKDKMDAYIPKSLNVSYYQQVVSAKLVREDSTSFPASGVLPQYSRKELLMELSAGTGRQYETSTNLALSWTDGLSIPVAEVERGEPLSAASSFTRLPTFTVGSRSYQDVLEYTPVSWGLPQVKASWQLRRLRYTKAEGIIQFEEIGGSVWERQ